MQRTLCRLLLIVTVASTARAEPITVRRDGSLATFTGDAFGTTFTIKVALEDEADARDADVLDALSRQIPEAIERLNREMSLWDDDSELSRFNRSAGGEWFSVSPETLQVIDAALGIRKATDGAFDPTVRPLLALWSFGPGQRPRRIPEPAEIEAARALTGVAIETREQPTPAIWKAETGVALDLNAIAKGFAVDVAAEIVASHHPRGYMVEIGGEVRTDGTKPDGAVWRIAIERPLAGNRAAATAIRLDGLSLATSGDYRNYFEVNGQRFSHTIDPRTGRPISHNLASVSVIAETCMEADAWATALMVLGPEAGYELATRSQVAALFFIRESEVYRTQATPGFPELTPLNSPLPPAAPWSTFLIAAVVFGVAVAGMAIGAILSGRRLRGSCGGLNGLKDSQGNPLCDACTTPAEECTQLRRQIAASQRQPTDE